MMSQTNHDLTMTCKDCNLECQRFGEHRNGLRRFRCPNCKRTYTEPHTKTLDAMNIPWDKALLAVRIAVGRKQHSQHGTNQRTQSEHDHARSGAGWREGRKGFRKDDSATCPFMKSRPMRFGASSRKNKSVSRLVMTRRLEMLTALPPSSGQPSWFWHGTLDAAQYATLRHSLRN